MRIHDCVYTLLSAVGIWVPILSSRAHWPQRAAFTYIESMKAVWIEGAGGAERLTFREMDDPEPSAGELLIRVKAAGINRADIMQREGNYPPPAGASPILGLEIAGTVERTAGGTNDDTDLSQGDGVCALLPGGGYAELATADAGHVFPIPDGLDFAQAAAVPEAFLTAFQALHFIGELRKEERVLIHAGASGVGTAAIQLARVAGASVYATAGTDEKCGACRELGAVHAINYRSDSFAERVLSVTDGEGVDLIVDFVGASYFNDNLSLLRRDGRLVLLSLLSGSKLEQTDIAPLLVKRIRIEGSTLRSRTADYKRDLVRAFVSHSFSDFERNELHPVVDTIFDWSDVADAHRYMEADRNIGKLVLTGM